VSYLQGLVIRRRRVANRSLTSDATPTLTKFYVSINKIPALIMSPAGGGIN